MARISGIEKQQTSKDMQDIFAEIEGAFGKIPNLFKTYSHFPQHARILMEDDKGREGIISGI